MDTQSPPSKFFAYVAVVVGGVLLLSGVGAFFRCPGVAAFGRDGLGPQLGQMAGMFLGLVCGPLAIYHGISSIANRRSRRLKLPPVYFFWIAFALVLGRGNILLTFHAAEDFLFPPLFLLGAALPTVAVVAWAARRLGWPVPWRQAALGLGAGRPLSHSVASFLRTG